MSTLVIDRGGHRLSLEGDAIALHEHEVRRGSVPIRILDRVILQGHDIRIDVGVLLKLAEAGVSTVLLSGRSSQRRASLIGPGHGDARLRTAQALASLDQSFSFEVARELVMGKVRRQAEVLAKAAAERPDLRKPMFDARRTLVDIQASIGPASEVDALRGLEGAAAAAYFRAFGELLPDSLGFCGRNRRPPRDPVNACLSLGYTLLHAEGVQSAHARGLDPLLGFYHRPSHGRESLACDLIEPLRPAIDEWLWMLIRTRVLRADHFSMESGACRLGKAGRAAFYQSWHQWAPIWRRWLRQQCNALAKRIGEPNWPLDDDACFAGTDHELQQEPHPDSVEQRS